jgi:hypothetical protein
MLFNLSTQTHFKSQHENAIGCYSDNGPVFAGSKWYEWDLVAFEPFNGENNCISYANCVGYRIGDEGGKNKLTN